MRFPLTVMSLALLAIFVLWQLSVLMARKNPRRFGAQPAQGANDLPSMMANVCKDVLFLYVPFAAISLMMVSFGKPGLLPQYTGWALVVLQLLRAATVALEWPRMRSALGLLALICLIYLWVLQLPYFDPYPA